jgi:hypothetical protein
VLCPMAVRMVSLILILSFPAKGDEVCFRIGAPLCDLHAWVLGFSALGQSSKYEIHFCIALFGLT